MSEVMKVMNTRLEKGSLFNTDELADFIHLIYDGWEELKDGFHIGDTISLAGTAIKAYTESKVALAEAMDLQDDEIIKLVDLSKEYELGDLADEARQVVKCLLVLVQTYDKLIHEKKE